MREFPRGLAQNFTGLFASENLMPLLIGTAGTFAAMPLQDNTKGFFENQERWQGYAGLGREGGQVSVHRSRDRHIVPTQPYDQQYEGEEVYLLAGARVHSPLGAQTGLW